MGLRREFRPQPRGSARGAAFDAGCLRALAEHEPDRPRRWVHYLEFDDEEGARRARDRLMAEWPECTIGPNRENDGWDLVIARGSVHITPMVVAQTRSLLEELASGIDGGSYCGWGFGEPDADQQLAS